MNLANSLGVQNPKLLLLSHTPIQTDNVVERRGNDVVTRIVDQDGIWGATLTNIKVAPTHDESKTISEKLAYRKFIKDSEFETREVFDRENSKREISRILGLD